MPQEPLADIGRSQPDIGPHPELRGDCLGVERMHGWCR